MTEQPNPLEALARRAHDIARQALDGLMNEATCNPTLLRQIEQTGAELVVREIWKRAFDRALQEATAVGPRDDEKLH